MTPPGSVTRSDTDPTGAIVVVFILVIGALIVLPIRACSAASRDTALQFALGVHGREEATVTRLALEPLAGSVLRCMKGVCEGPAAKATRATLAASRVESTVNIGMNGDHCVELLAQQGDLTTRLYVQVHQQADRWQVKDFCTDRSDCPACDVP